MLTTLATLATRTVRLTYRPVTSRLYSTEVKVPIDLIKALRTKTKAGISDCRNALAEAGLDLEKAEVILQSKAKGVAEKKSTRLAAEGLLAAVTNKTNNKVAVVELLCETDFASRSPSFGSAVVKLAQKALDGGHNSQEALQNADGVKADLEQLIFTLRENISLRRVNVVESNLMGIYMHQRVDSELGIKADPNVNGKVFLGGRVAIVDFNLTSDNLDSAVKVVQPTVDKLAVHVLSMEPKFIDKASAPAGTDAEDILMEQEFGLGGEGKTVAQEISALQKKIAKTNSKITLKAMHRFICGEGIEKKSGEDFGDEVAKLLKKD